MSKTWQLVALFAASLCFATGHLENQVDSSSDAISSLQFTFIGFDSFTTELYANYNSRTFILTSATEDINSPVWSDFMQYPQFYSACLSFANASIDTQQLAAKFDIIDAALSGPTSTAGDLHLDLLVASQPGFGNDQETSILEDKMDSTGAAVGLLLVPRSDTTPDMLDDSDFSMDGFDSFDSANITDDAFTQLGASFEDLDAANATDILTQFETLFEGLVDLYSANASDALTQLGALFGGVDNLDTANVTLTSDPVYEFESVTKFRESNDSSTSIITLTTSSQPVIGATTVLDAPQMMDFLQNPSGFTADVYYKEGTQSFAATFGVADAEMFDVGDSVSLELAVAPQTLVVATEGQAALVGTMLAAEGITSGAVLRLTAKGGSVEDVVLDAPTLETRSVGW